MSDGILTERDKENICRSFSVSTNKRKQIGILAELYLCGKEVIIDVLREDGVIGPHDFENVAEASRKVMKLYAESGKISTVARLSGHTFEYVKAVLADHGIIVKDRQRGRA